MIAAGLATDRSNRSKTCGGFYLVMAGLVPAIPIIGALCRPGRDRRDKPGDDKLAATSFAPIADRTIRRIAVAGFVVVALFAVPLASAQQAAVRDRCIHADAGMAPNAVIAACTTLIEAYVRGEIEPSDAATAYVVRGNAQAAIGQRNLATADYDRAIAIYDGAIARGSNDANMYLGRGNASFLKRDYDRAIADYDAMLAIAPNSVDAFLGRGRSFYQKRDYDRAIANYDRVLGLDPNHAEALAERGDAHEQNRQF